MRLDFSGILNKHIYLLKLWKIKSFYTIVTRFKVFIYGIKTGDNCIYFGSTLFLRKPNTKIIIGNNCIFRSSSLSNLIGINRHCVIATHQRSAILIIGNNCGFSGTVIGAFKQIIIGNNVRCGANTLITDSDWHIDDPRVGTPKEVFIDDNVWLGINVVVLKGVTIGKNSIIGANSIVTGDIPENVLAAGNPCRIIRQINI